MNFCLPPVVVPDVDDTKLSGVLDAFIEQRNHILIEVRQVPEEDIVTKYTLDKRLKPQTQDLPLVGL